jgi:hypothetical protein
MLYRGMDRAQLDAAYNNSAAGSPPGVLSVNAGLYRSA